MRWTSPRSAAAAGRRDQLNPRIKNCSAEIYVGLLLPRGHELLASGGTASWGRLS